jgi:hypothetical protein
MSFKGWSFQSPWASFPVINGFVPVAGRSVSVADGPVLYLLDLSLQLFDLFLKLLDMLS